MIGMCAYNCLSSSREKYNIKIGSWPSVSEKPFFVVSFVVFFP